MYRRRTARVLVVDAAGRLLLLRFRHHDGGHLWLTPGGGVRRWESLRRAAAREVREEVGLVVRAAALGTPVAHTRGYAELGWAEGQFRDDFFLHRIDGHEVDTAAMESHERSHYEGHRWWSVDDLRATADRIVPWGLADLLARLIGPDQPGPAFRPVRLPWHR